MKKLLGFVLAVWMLFSLVSCAFGPEKGTTQTTEEKTATQQQTQPLEENIIKIGVFEPQSGENKIGGKQEMLGVTYANQYSPNVVLGDKTYKISLIYSDNESSPEKAPQVAQKLVDEGVSLVIGSYGSDVCLAAADVFSEAGVPVIGASCTSPAVTESAGTYYRVCYLDPYQARSLASFAFKQLGIRKVMTLACLGSDYDQSLSFYFRESFEALGGTVLTENFTSQVSDFSSVLEKAVSKECQAVFAPVSLSFAKLLIEQSAALDADLTFLGADNWDCNVVLRASDSVNADVYVASYYQQGVNEKFDSGIRGWFNSDPTAKANNAGDDTVSAACAAGFDAYCVALKAIRTAGSADRDKILAVLPKVTVTGACGKVAFDSERNAKRSFAYIKKANNRSVSWDAVTQQSF